MSLLKRIREIALRSATPASRELPDESSDIPMETNPAGERISAIPEDVTITDDWPPFGRVAKVLDKQRVVATIGRDGGVEYGDEYFIFSPNEKIHDHENDGEYLGRQLNRKAILGVEWLQDDISVLKVLRCESDDPVAYGDFIRRQRWYDDHEPSIARGARRVKAPEKYNRVHRDTDSAES